MYSTSHCAGRNPTGAGVSSYFVSCEVQLALFDGSQLETTGFSPLWYKPLARVDERRSLPTAAQRDTPVPKRRIHRCFRANGTKSESNVIRVHGQFWEDQEVDCLAVVTGHAAMRVPQSLHLIDPLKCCHKVRSVPESKRRVATKVRSSGVVDVVPKVGNHRLDNANTQWPFAKQWRASVGTRRGADCSKKIVRLWVPYCTLSAFLRDSIAALDLSEAATRRQDARPGPSEKVVEQVFDERRDREPRRAECGCVPGTLSTSVVPSARWSGHIVASRSAWNSKLPQRNRWSRGSRIVRERQSGTAGAPHGVSHHSGAANRRAPVLADLRTRNVSGSIRPNWSPWSPDLSPHSICQGVSGVSKVSSGSPNNQLRKVQEVWFGKERIEFQAGEIWQTGGGICGPTRLSNPAAPPSE